MPCNKSFSALRTAVVFLALLLFLPGCSGHSAASSMGEDRYAETLYNSRVASSSDSAGIDSLLAQLGISNWMGIFTVETNASKTPGTLTLHFEQAPDNSSVFADQFEYYSVLLLALVEDCEQVRCTYPDGSDTCTLEWSLSQANSHLSVDVAGCGQSAEGIATLLDTLHTAHANNQNFESFFEEAGYPNA